jgi:polar amino acid transport system substrate-binding protein
MRRNIPLALAAVLVCAAFLLAACQDGPRTLTVATDASFRPMQYQDESGGFAGFEVELLRAAAERAGFRIQLKNVPWADLFSGLEAGAYDVASASLTVTAERKARLDFSEPFLDVQQALLVRLHSVVAKRADLHGRIVGVQRGTRGETLAKSLPGLLGVRAEDIIYNAIEALLKGEIQAVLADMPVAAEAVREAKGQLRVVELLPPAEPDLWAFAVRKGDTRTLELLHKGLAAARADGTWQALFDRHLKPGTP